MIYYTGLNLIFSTMHSIKRYGAIIAAAAALILVGAGCFGTPAPQAQPQPQTAPANEPGAQGGPTSAMRIRGNVVIAFEQKPGETLQVAVVDADKPAFVIVRDSSGDILGASALLALGESNDLSIKLSRSTKNGETLTMNLYADDGTGTYGPGDTALLDYNGDPVSNTVIIDANASEGPHPAL